MSQNMKLTSYLDITQKKSRFSCLKKIHEGLNEDFVFECNFWIFLLEREKVGDCCMIRRLNLIFLGCGVAVCWSLVQVPKLLHIRMENG